MIYLVDEDNGVHVFEIQKITHYASASYFDFKNPNYKVVNRFKAGLIYYEGVTYYTRGYISASQLNSSLAVYPMEIQTEVYNEFQVLELLRKLCCTS